jgi:hypothetical protein
VEMVNSNGKGQKGTERDRKRCRLRDKKQGGVVSACFASNYRTTFKQENKSKSKRVEEKGTG